MKLIQAYKIGVQIGTKNVTSECHKFRSFIFSLKQWIILSYFIPHRCSWTLCNFIPYFLSSRTSTLKFDTFYHVHLFRTIHGCQILCDTLTLAYTKDSVDIFYCGTTKLVGVNTLFISFPKQPKLFKILLDSR